MMSKSFIIYLLSIIELILELDPDPELADQRTSRISVTSFTRPLSDISDDELDMLLTQLRTHYRRAGVTMLGGMLLHLGYRIPRERIRLSLIRIDPVQRVFQRIKIRRRVYSVPGPNSL